jgi:hypothetical protein
MSLVLATLLAIAPCEIAARRQSDLQNEAVSWSRKHNSDCTLCASGTWCREGFERHDGARRAFDSWMRTHSAACAMCMTGAPKCAAVEAAWRESVSAAEPKHRERCRGCDLDPMRCAAWKAALDDVRARHEDWKREHPATCERCAPPCDAWKRAALDASVRSDEALRKHRERCMDCQKGGTSCERPAALKADRVALWKRHAETCACRKPLR